MDDQGFTPAMLLDSHNKPWTYESRLDTVY